MPPRSKPRTPSTTLADERKAGYNMGMKRFALIACLAGSFAAAAEEKKPSGPDEKTRIKIAEYMLRTPMNEASPTLIEPFLALDPETLPKRLREKGRAKQLEIRMLLKLHDTKKKGSVLQPVEGCTISTFLRSVKDIPLYQMMGFGEITEDEEKEVMDRTLCREIDLGCHFSLMIFHDAGSKKPRRLFLHGNDPMMSIVALARDKVKRAIGGNCYFGVRGVSCMH